MWAQRHTADLNAVQIGFSKRLFRAEYKKRHRKVMQTFYKTDSFFSLNGSLRDDKQTLN